MFNRKFEWTRIASVTSALALVAGCEMVRCPEGMVPDSQQGKCVALEGDAASTETPDPQPDVDSGSDPALEADSEADASTLPDGPGPGDAQPNLAPAPEAGADAAMDAEIEAAAATATEDARLAELDGGAVADAATDALVEASPADTGTDAELACDPANLYRFRTFQVSKAMVDAAVACGGSLATCVEPGCEVARCIRAQAGVKACAACIEAEGRCVAQQCADDCGANGTADRCLSCACYARCFDTNAACGLEPIDICSGCNRTSCVKIPILSGWYQPQETFATRSRSALQPVAITRGPGSVEVMWISDQGSLEYMANNPGAGSYLGTSAANVGAPASTTLSKGSLAVTAWGNGSADVVARGADKRLWHRKLESLWLPTWGAWDTPSTDVPLLDGDRVAIASRGTRITDAVFAGEDGNVYHASWSAGASVVSNLGAPAGVRLRGPHVASNLVDSLDVVARGDDARLYHKRWEPGGWSEWQNPCSAVMTGLPWVATTDLRTMHAFWREELPDGSGALKMCLRDASGWAPITYPPGFTTWPFLTTESDLELDLSVSPTSPTCFQGGSRSRNQSLLTFAIHEQKSWWFHGASTANVGPYPISYVSPGAVVSVWVFGTLDGGIGALAWRPD